MTSILTSIVYIKAVSGVNVYTDIAYSRVDNEEFVKLNFKAFRQNSEEIIQEIKENSIMMMI